MHSLSGRHQAGKVRQQLLLYKVRYLIPGVGFLSLTVGMSDSHVTCILTGFMRLHSMLGNFWLRLFSPFPSFGFTEFRLVRQEANPVEEQQKMLPGYVLEYGELDASNNRHCILAADSPSSAPRVAALTGPISSV